jgi:hypothetical protein
MSWKKYFQSSSSRDRQKIAARFSDDPMTAASPNSFSNRFTSWLPEVYSGQPNRIERYSQYDNMDLDTEINMALDTIADSMSEANGDTRMPFNVRWSDDASEIDVDVLEQALAQWVRVNEFDKRVWKLVRSVLKYGDQFFIRDPDSYKLFWVSPDKIDSVVVDEAKGKKPEQYIVRDLDANLQTLVATGNQKKPSDQRGYSSGPMASGQQGGALNTAGRTPGARFNAGVGGAQTGAGAGLAYYVDADNVVHMSLSEGMDNVWPFGVSILENVFKVFKQMELIEDAVIIYRVQRAPERRVFYVDTGKLPNHRAMAYLERIKNEIQQKRIPSRGGGQGNITDATYNPMSMLEDYFFAQSSDGKGSRVETLPGGDQLGQIDDMKYFHHKIRTGLRVPRSYMPDFDDGGGAIFNDGRVGTAYIEELRFTKYCVRLQNMISPHLDREFKLFLKNRGINIHASLFELMFNEPQNFSKYRQTEVDGAVLSVYSQAADISHISKRMGMQKYLGWTPDEILTNERYWAEENEAKLAAAKAGEIVSGGDEETSFGDAGASSAGIGGDPLDDGEFNPDGDDEGAEDMGMDSVISGDEGDVDVEL